MKKKVTFIVHAAVIAALYVVLTLAANTLGLANYAIQIRISEALTILPIFTPAAIPGLFIGCLLSNFLTGCLLWDTIFGSLATLLGALGTYAIRKKTKEASPRKSSSCFIKWLAPLPPIIANILIIPFVLSYIYKFEGSIPYFMLTVGIGELLSCGVLGILLYNILQKYQKYIF